MGKIDRDMSKCNGCGICVKACPLQAISVSDFTNTSGYNVVKVDDEECVGCGTCYRVCPNHVFAI